LKKRTKKLLHFALTARRGLRHPGAAPGAKVFASFFKKKRFLPSPGEFPPNANMQVLPEPMRIGRVTR
jgi:hypothetical protein